MRLDRLNRGEAIALVSASLLFVVMFFSWYGSEISGQAGQIDFGAGAGAGGSAWATLEVISFVLMLTIAVTVGTGLLRLLGSKWKPIVPPSAAITVLGGLSFLLVLFRIVFPPDFGTLGGIAVNATLELGIFLGLIAAAGVAYGGYRAMGQRGISFAKIADELGVKPARSGAKPAPRPPKPKQPSEKRPEPRS
jgi:hypothetical protein